MTGPAARRTRILRLRALEERIAGAHLARAVAALDGVRTVEARLASLRAGLAAPAGPIDAQSLLSAAELATRLDSASAGLERSRTEAIQNRDASQAAHQATRLRAERITRLHERATREEAAAQDRRIAAALPLARRLHRPLP